MKSEILSIFHCKDCQLISCPLFSSSFLLFSDRLYDILVSGEAPEDWIRCFFFSFREVFAVQELFSRLWDSCERDESAVERVCPLIEMWFSNSPNDFRFPFLSLSYNDHRTQILPTINST